MVRVPVEVIPTQASRCHPPCQWLPPPLASDQVLCAHAPSPSQPGWFKLFELLVPATPAEVFFFSSPPKRIKVLI